MNVFIENQSSSSSSFEIEVDFWDKVLDIKTKIDKSQHIPVSKQTLFFQGKVLQDDLDVEHFDIDHESRLQLFISPEHNLDDNNDNLLQTQKSPLPSLNDELLSNQEDSPSSGNDNHDLQGEKSPLSSSIDEFLSIQEDSPVKVVSSDNDNQILQGDKSPLPSIEEFFDLQDSSSRVGSSDNSPMFQNEQSSESFGDNTFDEDLPLTIEHVSNIQSWPIPPEEISNDQDSQMTTGSNNNTVFQTQQSPLSDRMNHIINKEYSRVMNSLQNEKSPSLDSAKETINIPEEIVNNQDSQMILGSNNNIVCQTQQSPLSDRIKHILDNEHSRVMNWLQTEKSPSLNSTKETINIPDSHKKPNTRKLRVMVLPFSSESKAEKEIPVDVNEDDNINELRKVLAELQSRTQMNLCEEGYFFKHKQRVLDDDQSFQCQGVANGDQIEISPKDVTHDGSTEK